MRQRRIHRVVTRAVGVILASLLFAKQAVAFLELAAWGIVLAVIGLIAAVGIALATSDNSPEIGAIQIRVEDAGVPDWHVGQLRVISVETDVSFGHIRGDDVGVITLEVDFDGDVAYRETRRYTEEDDGDPDTVTLGRWEGTLTFAMEVEALDHGIGSIGAKVIVDGESNGLFSDPAASASDNHTLTVEALYPLEVQSGSDAIGWLSPDEGSISHHECFDQTLQVRNRATVPGEIHSARIAHTTAEDVPFSAANSDATARVTDVVTGPVGHEDVPIHLNSADFPTDWSLQGSRNVRVFLRAEDEWSNDGGTGPSSLSNSCTGGTLNCTLLDQTLPAIARNVDTTYALEILSRGAPRRAGASRQVMVSDNSGLSQIRTTDASGIFSLTAPALGPLVNVDLVTGSDAAFFEPKLLVAVNASLFDPSLAPTFQTFQIREREAPPISGQAVDALGAPVVVDVFGVSVGGEENYLGRSTGSIDISGGIDVSRVGYPNALFRVRPVAAFNRAYLKPELEIGLPSTDPPMDLGTLLFEEAPPAVGPVVFKGRFEIRDPDGLGGQALVGLLLEVEGVGTVLTDALGAFEIVVPASGIPRVVRLAAPGAVTTVAGQPLHLQGLPEVSVEFGRGGSMLDLGTVTLHSAESPPAAVPLLPSAGLALLVALLGGMGLRFARGR